MAGRPHRPVRQKPEAVVGRARLRDALTGQILIDADGHLAPGVGPLFYRVASADRIDFTPTKRQRDEGHEDERTPIPLGVHTKQEIKDELGLGSREWTRAFAHYLAHVLPRQIAEGDRELEEWWRVPYVVQRVRRGFLAHYPGRVAYAEMAFACALAALRFPESVDTLLAEAHKEPGWLIWQCHLAHRFAYQRRPIGCGSCDRCDPCPVNGSSLAIPAA